MNKDDQKFLEGFKPRGRNERSRLFPHMELIQALRVRKAPFREVAQILQERHGIRVSPGTIHAFLSAKCRQPAKDAPVQRVSRTHASNEDRNAALAKIRAANAKPSSGQLDLPTFCPTDEPLVIQKER